MNLLPIVIALAAGIYSAEYINITFAVLGVVVFITLCLVQKIFKNFNMLDMAVTAVIFLVGIFLYHSAMYINIDHVGDYVTVGGVVAELPYESGGINKYVVYCNEMEFDGEKTKLNKKIMISSDKFFKCGDSIEAMGKLNELSDDAHSYGFDTKRSLAGRGIQTKMTALDIHLSDTKYKCHRLDYYSNLIRSKAAEWIYRFYSGDIAAAMLAIITGDKHAFSDTYNDVLLYTSMRQLFYPAFLHIALIVSFVGIFSGIIQRKIRDYILLAILVLYAVFNSGYSAPLKAASILIALILFSKILGSTNKINALSAFALLAVLINPMLLFSGGFVVSVFSTAMMLYMMPVFKSKGNIKNKIIRILILQIGILPLAAYFFGHVGIYSFAASIVFIPLVAAVIILSPFMLISMAFNIMSLFVWVVHKLILVILHIPIWVSYLPFAGINLPKPSVVFLLAFYTGVAALWYFKKRNKQEKAKLYSVVSAGFAAVCVIAFLSNANRLEVNFIDVGQGDAALVHMPFSGNILIDGGGGAAYSEYNIGKNVFVPYLSSRGANVIQAAFVSHYHKDHAEGIVEAVKALDVKNLFLPDVTPDDEWRIKLEEAAKENNTKIWYVFSPMHISMDDVDLFVYPPSKDVLSTEDANNSSLMINLSYGEFNCLFTGDMTALEEKSMISRNLLPKAEVLKVGHHGSATSTTKEFVKAVSPQISLIGCGKNNQFGFPKSDVLENLKDTQIYRTDLDGDISLFADKRANIKVKKELVR